MGLEERFPGVDEIPENLRVDASAQRPVLVIDGKVEVFDGTCETVTSPVATREGDELTPVELGSQAMLGADHAARAIDAAQRAWGDGLGEWPSASVADRIAAVERFADALDADLERLATLLMYEIGKPFPSAHKEVRRSIEYIRETNGILREMDEASREAFVGMKGSTAHHAVEQRHALGKVKCVAPFNYPVNELLTTIVPALLMGNVVIAKTPRFGMLSNLASAEAYASCFPAGVVSLLPGDGRAVIPAVMQATRKGADGQPVQGAIDMLAFIGSEGAANAILGHHPSPVSLHKVLGLGSKNPAIILQGADLELAASKIVKGSLGFNGQRCTAEKIIFVHRSEADRFVDIFAEKVAALKVGMPWDEGVAITPLPEHDKPMWMAAYIDDALARGAKVVNEGGGEAFHTLMRPAVLYPVTDEMRIYHEEQFGPIVPIAVFDELDEVYRWQQRSPFGQQVGIWGPVEKVEPVVRAFRPQVARININDICQRGPDSFGFTATDKSGFGILSLRGALTTFSRPVLIQAIDKSALNHV
jgi:glyceraldehyde-3-phosphate dehydrogenase (NADP+)